MTGGYGQWRWARTPPEQGHTYTRVLRICNSFVHEGIVSRRRGRRQRNHSIRKLPEANGYCSPSLAVNVVSQQTNYSQNTSYMPPHPDYSPRRDLHVQDFVSASYPRAESVVAQSKIYPSQTSSWSLTGRTARQPDPWPWASFCLTSASQSMRSRKVHETMNLRQLQCFKNFASAVIFQESFSRDPPSYRWEAPSHEGRFSFEPGEQ